ncbi:MAG: hypothetical protein CMI54_06340 [Parcubacteria group bacterium]|jgi:hypothetical protein|nr:hypothetical protein [Parcubacteria group bacterium]|tara:strand:- start:2617 stop:3024 length:408 start_codon:yes stop_codon:yes gene_type:complete
MEEFFTRQKSNEGVKLPLVHPDGSPSKHWIKVRNTKSDAFRDKLSAQYEMQQAAIGAQDENGNAIEVEALDQNVLLATLIADWSLEDELSDENKLKLMVEAPQIADQIDKYATNNKLFFSDPSKDSTTTLEKSAS